MHIYIYIYVTLTGVDAPKKIRCSHYDRVHVQTFESCYKSKILWHFQLHLLTQLKLNISSYVLELFISKAMLNLFTWHLNNNNGIEFT